MFVHPIKDLTGVGKTFGKQTADLFSLRNKHFINDPWRQDIGAEDILRVLFFHARGGIQCVYQCFCGNIHKIFWAQGVKNRFLVGHRVTILL